MTDPTAAVASQLDALPICDQEDIIIRWLCLSDDSDIANVFKQPFSETRLFPTSRAQIQFGNSFCAHVPPGDRPPSQEKIQTYRGL